MKKNPPLPDPEHPARSLAKPQRQRLLRGVYLSLLALWVGAIAKGAVWLLQDVPYGRFESPAGDYVAIASSPTYLNFLPAMPGQGGDKPGWITIQNAAGDHYGTIPTPMVSLIYSLEWTPEGALLVGVGEWDFATQTYRYWTANQSRSVVRQARP